MLANIQLPPFQNSFVQELDQFFIKFKDIFSTQLSQTLKDSNQMLQELKLLFDDNEQNMKNVGFTRTDLDNLSNLIEKSTNLIEKRKIIEDLATQFETIKSKLTQSGDVNIFNKQLNKTIHEFTLNEINNILMKRTKSVNIIKYKKIIIFPINQLIFYFS